MFGFRDCKLSLLAACRYPVWDWKEVPFRPEDHRARFFTLAVKGDLDRIKNTYQMLGKPQKRYDRTNLDELLPVIGDYIAKEFPKLKLPEAVLVPVPNSSTTPGSGDFRIAKFARAIAERSGGALTVFDGVRFQAPMAKAAGGGGVRKKEAVLPHLVLSKPIVDHRPAIIVDDVCTSGGHLHAVQEFLRLNGVTAAHAAVAGRTVHEPMDPMIKPPPESLDDWWMP